MTSPAFTVHSCTHLLKNVIFFNIFFLPKVESMAKYVKERRLFTLKFILTPSYIAKSPLRVLRAKSSPSGFSQNGNGQTRSSEFFFFHGFNQGSKSPFYKKNWKAQRDPHELYEITRVLYCSKITSENKTYNHLTVESAIQLGVSGNGTFTNICM